MRMSHFRAQNGPFVLNKILQTIIIACIYLLALFIKQNLKKFFQWIQSYEDAQFLGPKWPISTNENFSENLLVSFIHTYLRAKNQSQILNFHFIWIPDKINFAIFLKSPKTMFLGHFWPFLPDGNFFQKIWLGHTQLYMSP